MQFFFNIVLSYIKFILNLNEDEHDIWKNSHSRTSLAWLKHGLYTFHLYTEVKYSDFYYVRCRSSLVEWNEKYVYSFFKS